MEKYLYSYYKPTTFSSYLTPVVSEAPVTSSNFFSYGKPLESYGKDLIAPGAQRLIQAMAKLNELSTQLPTYLAIVSPQTKSGNDKINGIVNDLCARAMSEINPTVYSKSKLYEDWRKCATTLPR